MKIFKHLMITVAGAVLMLGWPGVGFSQDIFAAAATVNANKGSFVPNVCEQLRDVQVRNKKIYQKCLRGASSSGIAKADFNGDGFGDLAIGVPHENLSNNSAADAGAVVVIYGTSTGLNPAGGNGVPASQFWSQGVTGVPGSSETGDLFGTALAAGDFNGDEFSDLAIGAPGEDAIIEGATFRNTGAVTVIYGSTNGLSAANPVVSPQFWDVGDVPGISLGFGTGLRLHDIHFGQSLAWGDFNNDGLGDLAIGIPDQAICITPPLFCDLKPSAGVVAILYGSSGGLTSTNEFWDQRVLLGAPENGDLFGATLAGGDFDGDGFSDLAIGVPGEDIGTVGAAGAVNVIYGSSGGLTASGNQFWHKDSAGIIDFAAAGDQFGRALAAGDFNGDGRTDLAVGVPFHNLGSASNAGSVSVIYGSSGSGLTATGNQIFTQNGLFSSTVETAETGDNFGLALAAGDFNGDGKADLAIGVPNEDVVSALVTNRPVVDAGEVNVVYGSSTGLSRTAGPGAQIWHQENIGSPIPALEAGDRFGSALTAWNFGRIQFLPGIPIRPVVTADLAIGVPFEDVFPFGTTDFTSPQIADAGAINVIYGSAAGLSVSGSSGASQTFSQESPGIGGGAETGDLFGSALY